MRLFIACDDVTFIYFIFFLQVSFSLFFAASIWFRAMLTIRKAKRMLISSFVLVICVAIRPELRRWWCLVFAQAFVHAFPFVNGRHLSLIFCNVNFLIPLADKTKVCRMHIAHHTLSIRNVTSKEGTEIRKRIKCEFDSTA